MGAKSKVVQTHEVVFREFLNKRVCLDNHCMMLVKGCQDTAAGSWLVLKEGKR